MLGRHIHKFWVTGPLDFTRAPSLANFARLARFIAAVEVYACLALHGNIDLRTTKASTRYRVTLDHLSKLANFSLVRLALWAYLRPIIFRVSANKETADFSEHELGVDLSRMVSVDLDAAVAGEGDKVGQDLGEFGEAQTGEQGLTESGELSDDAGAMHGQD